MFLSALARKHLIFGLGTDTHHVRDWSEIDLALKKLSKYYTADELKAITETNPRKILANAK